MRKIRKGDEVLVISGKDKGKQGKVFKVLPKKNLLLVEGINLIHKHIKPNPQRNITGGINKKESLLKTSKVMLVNDTSNKRDRVGFKMLEDGKKVRFFKSNNEVVDL